MSFSIAIGARVRKSPYFDMTVKAGVTSFSIYNHMYMPVTYGDPMAEYDRLINGVAMWDVAVERQVQLEGPDAAKLAQYLTPRNLSKHKVGQGKYAPLCNHQGHIIADPICLKLSDELFWFSISDADIVLHAQAVCGEQGFDCVVSEPDVSPLAVQGPKAEDVVAKLCGDWVRELRYFWFSEFELDGIPLVVQRSGWSKQGGFELYLRDGSKGAHLWRLVAKAGKKYGIGPGAPNYFERVESGLVSMGADTLPDSTPFEVGLGKYCDVNQAADFVGKEALKAIAEEGPARRTVGLFLGGKPVAGNPHPYKLKRNGEVVGRVSVMAYSPRLERNIAIALLDSSVPDDAKDLQVMMSMGRPRKATVTTLPFI